MSSAHETEAIDSRRRATGDGARLRRGLVLGGGVVVVGLVLSVLPTVLAFDEDFGLGALFALRGPVDPPAQVAIIGISDAASDALGLPTKVDTWPRSVHAELVDRLHAAGAAVIVFDVAFMEQRDPASDLAFARAIEESGNVLLLERTENSTIALGNGARGEIERRLPPLKLFADAALGSAPFVLPKVPFRIAQSWSFSRASADVPSLPTVALQAYLLPQLADFLRLLEGARPGLTALWPADAAEAAQERGLEGLVASIRAAFRRDPALATDALRLLRLDTRLPSERKAALEVLIDVYRGANSRYLNLYGPARTVRTTPFDVALGSASLSSLKGKVVFVGEAEPHQPEQQDDFYSVFSQQTGINLSGVEVGATAVGNLLERCAIVPLAMPWHLGLVTAFGALLAIAVVPWTTRRAALWSVTIGLAYFGVAYWLFADLSIWLPLVVPLFVQMPAAFVAALAWSYRDVAAQRERVNKALGYYVPQSLARRLAERSVALGNDRELLYGTCLYTDAERYTSVAETLRPDELAALMNDYYRELFGAVERHGGQVSDTAGDSMVAIWASAEPSPAARAAAIEAALAILTAVERFNRGHPRHRLPTRIGLESGEMLLGNIGAEQRFEYRAVGDIVNTAARIQDLNTPLGTRVLVSAGTLAGIAPVPARELGAFLVRGKRLPVRVSEPLAAAGSALDAESLAAFAKALEAFRQGHWDRARASFGEVAARWPSDGPTAFYLGLCGEYSVRAPAAWDGVVALAAK